MEKKKGTKAKQTERNVYMAIIIILALYGLRDSEATVKLIESVSKALSVLLTLEWPMPQIRTFISDNIKSLTIVASFLISMYVQHLNNTARIDSLADRCNRIESKLEDQYQKIDAIKVDKTVFEATMQQFTSMQDDLKEMRRDIKEILKNSR